MLKTKENHAFLAVLNDFTFLMQLNTYLKSNPDCELDELKTAILNHAQPVSETVALTQSLYEIFVRENITGPSVYSLYVDEEKRPLVKGEPLRPREIDPLSYKNEKLQEKLLSHFERDSE